MLTVLLSAFNEENNPFFWETIARIKSLQSQGFAIAACAGVTPSADNTISWLEQAQIPWVEVLTNKRADRYNKALQLLEVSDDDWIILHHPRSSLQPHAYLSLTQLSSFHHWGAFTHQFDQEHPLLNFTSWWSNFVRGDIKKVYYLDHCLFVRKGLLEKVGGIPPREIFEDTVLSQKLAALHSPIRLLERSTTSAIRFQTNGIWSQAMKNQILKLRFHLSHNDSEMNREYEKGIGLNHKY